MAAALRVLTAGEATTPDVVRSRLPPTTAVLGPAALFYPPAGFGPGAVPGVVDVAPAEIGELLAAVPPDEADESGLAEVAGRLSASRTAGGDLAAACGWRPWPNGVAHLSVLTHPDHRRRGHARRAATAAIGRAIDEGLLPQWRARPPASRALARRLGLVELGAQLSLEPAR